MNKSSSHAIYDIKLHIVFVSKYRRKILNKEILADLKTAFTDCLAAWNCELLEFGGESDHVHLLVSIQPALNISILINNLKTASARRMRNTHAEHLSVFYKKPLFWHRAYFVASCGGAPLEKIKQYIENQGIKANTKVAC
jgi:putative transposase